MDPSPNPHSPAKNVCVVLPRPSALFRYRRALEASRTRDAPVPERPAEEESVGDFRVLLQTAMMIELSTIPLYLYAWYSCQSILDDAAKTIHGIVVEEMLHLVLAGNILLAVGGNPTLYTPVHFPTYPGNMIDRLPDLPLSLMPLTADAINMFIDVEIRSNDPPPPPPSPGGEIHYHSLGEFYSDLQLLAQELSSSFQPSFQNLQILDEDLSPTTFDEPVTPILTAADAVKAMTIIIDQGEGASATVTTSHIYKFSHMKPPTSGTFNVPTNPTTASYKQQPDIYAVSQLFDASFCYLLLTIQTIWQTPRGAKRQGLATGMMSIMRNVLSPLAIWLGLQPLGSSSSDIYAAPCFNYYDFTAGSGGVENALDQLKALAKDLPSGPASDDGVQGAVGSINALTPLN